MRVELVGIVSGDSWYNLLDVENLVELGPMAFDFPNKRVVV